MENKGSSRVSLEYEACREYKLCFGNYRTKDGKICEEGSFGLCNYCVECRRDCIHV